MRASQERQKAKGGRSKKVRKVSVWRGAKISKVNVTSGSETSGVIRNYYFQVHCAQPYGRTLITLKKSPYNTCHNACNSRKWGIAVLACAMADYMHACWQGNNMDGWDVVEFKNLLESYAAAFLSPLFVSFFCLLFCFGLLWRENLRRRSKEACSCFAVKVTGKNN